MPKKSQTDPRVPSTEAQTTLKFVVPEDHRANRNLWPAIGISIAYPVPTVDDPEGILDARKLAVECAATIGAEPVAADGVGDFLAIWQVDDDAGIQARVYGPSKFAVECAESAISQRQASAAATSEEVDS